MNDGSPPAAVSLVRRVLLASALLCSCVMAADSSLFPLKLERVDRAGGALVEPGAAALHLVFFATWCPPCVAELPALADLEARFGSSGYRLILVAVPVRQTKERLTNFLKDTKPPGELLFDSTGSAQDSLGVDRLPGHVLVGATGAVLYRSASLDDAFRTEIEKALAGTRTHGGVRR